jgi:hypothetical protein
MKTFKQFLTENGYPFLNVYNNEMETLFGDTKKDFIKNKVPTDSDENKTKRKLRSYLQYAKVIQD